MRLVGTIACVAVSGYLDGRSLDEDCRDDRLGRPYRGWMTEAVIPALESKRDAPCGRVAGESNQLLSSSFCAQGIVSSAHKAQ